MIHFCILGKTFKVLKFPPFGAWKGHWILHLGFWNCVYKFQASLRTRMNKLLFSGKIYVDSCMHFPLNERSSEAWGFSGSQQCGAAVKALGQKGAATEGLARLGPGAQHRLPEVQARGPAAPLCQARRKQGARWTFLRIQTSLAGSRPGRRLQLFPGRSCWGCQPTPSLCSWRREVSGLMLSLQASQQELENRLA